MTKITSTRLPEIAVEEIAEYMPDSALAMHMPLLQGNWDEPRIFLETAIAMHGVDSL